MHVYRFIYLYAQAVFFLHNLVSRMATPGVGFGYAARLTSSSQGFSGELTGRKKSHIDQIRFSLFPDHNNNIIFANF